MRLKGSETSAAQQMAAGRGEGSQSRPQYDTLTPAKGACAMSTLPTGDIVVRPTQTDAEIDAYSRLAIA
ncbi:MAG: hypothetical protein ACXVDA_09175, partial [Ktedonobacterales bacterium]